MRVRKASHDSIAAETDDDFFCFVFAEDLARFLEILLPLHPQWFLPGAALANFIRSGALVGRQSLVNGTILRHFAVRENLADVRAKLEAQGRILAIAALPAGIWLFRWTEGLQAAAGGTTTGAQDGATFSPGLLAALFIYGSIFAAKNYSVFRAADALVFKNLNASRLVSLADQFLATSSSAGRKGEGARVMPPGEMVDSEGVWGREADQRPTCARLRRSCFRRNS